MDLSDFSLEGGRDVVEVFEVFSSFASTTRSQVSLSRRARGRSARGRAPPAQAWLTGCEGLL
jgi:hypothetical protein